MDSETPLLNHEYTSKLVKSHRVAYAASCICCLFSASFTVFSLYTNAFEVELGYTPLQLNYVSICAVMGLYMCVPILGYTADTYRLSYLGIISCIAYLVGYGGCAWVIATQKSWIWMALFFGIVGIACSAGFISSLVNCARLHPNSAFLAISIPTTLYGSSSLLYSQIISKLVENGTEIPKIYIALSILLFLIGILAMLAPIWGRVNTPAQLNILTAQSTESNISRFFKDFTILWLLLSFVMVSGPLEMYQNNIGLLVGMREPHSAENVARQVAIFTGMSTIIRLISGAVTDAFGVKPTTFLLGILMMLSLSDFIFAQGWTSLSLTSAISGISYGSSFTLYPIIVSHICGIERFATYWGIFILGPAIGSFVFGVLFATNIQIAADYAYTFRVCSLVALMSFFIITFKIRSQINN